MGQDGTGTFAGQRWDETTYAEHDAGKLSRVEAENRYSGVLEADGLLTFLLAYASDGSGTYTGYERIVGTLGDRTGSFVLAHVGTFDDAAARAELSVVEGSGTGELVGLRGTGRLEAAYGVESYPYELDWELPAT